MAIEMQNERTLWSNAEADLSIVTGLAVQTIDGHVVASFGCRYLVVQGDWQIPCHSIEDAEEIASDILAGRRVLGREDGE